jgi:hypothetical protein
MLRSDRGGMGHQLEAMEFKMRSVDCLYSICGCYGVIYSIYNLEWWNSTR